MNLRQLECLVRVIEAGSMTRAAQQLHVAQPALGVQIKLLEDELGVELLVRHSRGVTPTQAGRLLKARALDILDRVSEARREVLILAGRAASPIRFGMTPSLMQIVGPEIAVRASERAPHVPLSISEDMSHLLIESLRRNDVDMILAYDVPGEPGQWRRPLYREDLVFVTAVGPSEPGPISLSEVLAQMLILPEPEDSVRALVERTAGQLGLTVRISQEIRSISGIKAMIQRGSGAGVLPYGTVMSDVNNGHLACRSIERPALRRTLYLAGRREAAASPGFNSLLEVIRDAIDLLMAAMGSLGERIPEEAVPAI
jgi:LysR family transcriptional regulator, nitrogen assimilation regulatory protein